MKKILLVAGIAICMAACKRSTVEHGGSGIVGKWKLTEYLADPGDGSGQWQAVSPFTSSYIEFRGDGTVTYTPGLQPPSHYRLTSDTTFTLIQGTNSIRQYYHIEGAILTIEGGCIERCGERYVAVK